MPPLHRTILGLLCVCAIGVAFSAVLGKPHVWQPLIVATAVVFALGIRALPALRGFQYTAWIIAAVVAAMIYPTAFLQWGDFSLRNRWLILFVVQAVMFGMGTQMSLRDFAGVIRAPVPVFIGIACQFTIMPLVGLALINIFSFPPEIAAGVILIGSCSSGLASNVMTWLARANLPLSVTMTACTTVLAPFITPLWMKLLAGQIIPVSYFGMMMEIVKIVIVPIGAALLHDHLKHASPQGRRVVSGFAVASAVWLLALTFGGWKALAAHFSGNALTAATIPGFVAGAILAGLAYHALTRRWPRIQSFMPVVSMAGIIYFTLVTTAAGRNDLLVVGGTLFFAAVLHNSAGYCLGYWLSRACRLDRNSARTVAFEVGLQNGGMATGIASAMKMLGTLGLASAIFSPWMNISGSVLANVWRRKPVS